MQFISINKFPHFLFTVVLLALVSACGQVRTDWNPQDYTVKRGDTLYSIAWRYEKDFKDIARWNQISSPYPIYPGQRLRMPPDDASGTIDREDKPVIEEYQPADRPAEEAKVAVVPESSKIQTDVTVKPEAVVVKKGDTLYSLARQQHLTPSQLARWNKLRPPYSIYPGQTLRLKPPASALGSKHTPPAVVASKPPVKTISKPKPLFPAKVETWQWPTRGKLVKTFSLRDTSRKGIAIAGNRGQSVKAAAAGKVVYSGNGLISYGNLVIIKHNNSYLSAYAYNRKLLVKEGEQVTAGQTIAHMGTTDGGRARLHFEIRKNGKPVNPLKYLPRNRG